jgi:hypothetical protein
MDGLVVIRLLIRVQTRKLHGEMSIRYSAGKRYGRMMFRDEHDLTSNAEIPPKHKTLPREQGLLLYDVAVSVNAAPLQRHLHPEDQHPPTDFLPITKIPILETNESHEFNEQVQHLRIEFMFLIIIGVWHIENTVNCPLKRGTA